MTFDSMLVDVGVRTRSADTKLTASQVRVNFTTLAGILAVSGLVELLLQRVVYRIGVHIPRDGAFLDAYRAATFGGDFAFRLTAVLLGITSVAAAVWFWQTQTRVPLAFLGALLVANLLAWPLGLVVGPTFALLVFVFGAVWVAGSALAVSRERLLVGALAAFAAAMAASQYDAAMTALGRQPPEMATIQLLSEAGLLAGALLVALASGLSHFRKADLAVAALGTLVLVAAYSREPSTVAILSLWATGVTMSLPGVFYIAAFGAVLFAAVSWLRRPETRHLAIALSLLMVAGLQPQALHHGITAFLGLTLLGMTPLPDPESEIRTEERNAAR